MTLIDKAEALAILDPAPNSKGGLWAKRKQALHDAIAALPARGVGVRPLVWVRADEDDGVPQWISGIYFIRYTAAGYKLRINGIEMPKRYLGNDGDYQAKADANKDHEARILAALSPDPVKAQAREAAARLLLDMLYMRNGAHAGVSKDDAQAMWEAASTRVGYAAVDAFLRSIIGERK